MRPLIVLLAVAAVSDHASQTGATSMSALVRQTRNPAAGSSRRFLCGTDTGVTGREGEGQGSQGTDENEAQFSGQNHRLRRAAGQRWRAESAERAPPSCAHMSLPSREQSKGAFLAICYIGVILRTYSSNLTFSVRNSVLLRCSLLRWGPSIPLRGRNVRPARRLLRWYAGAGAGAFRCA